MELLGKTLGNYRIDRLLKEGSIGTVYQAYDLSMQRDVAVKVIHPQFAHQPGFRERFPGEVSVTAQLNHPGIVRVLDFGQHKDFLYLVMEYLPGANLRQILDELIRQREWVSLNDAVRLVEQLCQTMDYAHQGGAFYWDLNPANLMFKPEPVAGLPFRVVLIDLQLAKLLKDPEINVDQISLGSPAYMSPEEVLGNQSDARSNVYSLGILLYELIVGIPPFPIKTVPEALLYHAQEVMPAPRSVRPDLPESLERVMLKALEKEPEKRYASAAEFGVALFAAMNDVTEIVELEGGQDGNLFRKYQESLSAPPVAASLMGEPEASNTDQQPVLATELVGAPPKAHISLQVFLEGKPPQTFTFEKDNVTIGRERDNDLILNDSKISRRHVQVTWDGSNYVVTDLNSANGTYLESTRLQAGVPTIWRHFQQMQIGSTLLRLMGESPTGTIAENYNVGPRTAVEEFGAEPLVVSVTPQQLTVEAGESVTATLSLLNQSPNPDYFTLSLTGIPNDWVNSLPSHVQLMPGEQKVTAFTLHIPREPQSRAGRHSISVQAASQTDPSLSVELKITLTVAPFSEFRAELQPPRLQAGHLGRITITNLGNIPDTYTVRFTDPAGELIFQPPQVQIRIPEGRSTYAEFVAQEGQRRLIGGEKSHTLSVYVSSPNADPQALHGELLSQGLFPTWVLPTILVLCLLTAGTIAALLFWIGRPATLTVLKNGDGVVTSSPVGIDCGSICSYQFRTNRTITLVAEPISPSTFGSWSGGGCSGTEPTCDVKLSADETITAIFNPPGSQTLVVTTTGNGTVSSSPEGITNCTGSCSHAYPENTTVTLTAQPQPPSTFAGWGGACSGTGPCIVTMSEVRSVIANFSLPGKKTLTVNVTGSGTVTSSPPGISCTSTCSFEFADNAPVTLNAVPAQNFTFGGWSGACSGTGTCTVTMSTAQTVTATFNAPGNQPLTVTVNNGSGANGTVTSSPVGINSCNASCSANFPSDQDVTLTAINGSSTTFVSWGGDCSSFGSSLTCTVRMNSPRSVTATFKTSDKQVVTAIIIADNKVYDGTNTATVHCSVSGVAASHNVTCSSGAATFATKDVGTWQVTATGLTLGGTDANKYQLSSTTATTSASITPATVTASITASDKTYDGTTAATLINCTLNGARAGDDVHCGGTANFADANVGTNKTVTVNNLTLSGTAMSNYTLSSATATTTATITKRQLTITPHGDNKVYDGNTNATVTLSDDRLPGDDISTSYTNASFDNQNAGTGKTVTVSGISISGADAGNYNLPATSTSTMANITRRPITVTADHQEKKKGDPDPELTYAITSGTLVPGDNFAGALSRETGEELGDYDILQGTLTLGNNYNLTFVSATLTIKS